MSPEPFAIDVELALRPGTDERAPGGEVTVALCGHWEHEGACRWPHNSAFAAPSHLRTVVSADAADRAEIISRVEQQLRADERWAVVGFATGEIAAGEQALADRLAQSPRR